MNNLLTRIFIIFIFCSCNSKNSNDNYPNIESKIIDSFDLVFENSDENFYYLQILNDSSLTTEQFNKVKKYIKNGSKYELSKTIEFDNLKSGNNISHVAFNDTIFVFNNNKIFTYDNNLNLLSAIDVDLDYIYKKIPFGSILYLHNIYLDQGVKQFVFLISNDNYQDFDKLLHFYSYVIIDIENKEKFQFIFNRQDELFGNAVNYLAINNNIIYSLSPFSDTLKTYNLKLKKENNLALNINEGYYIPFKDPGEIAKLQFDKSVAFYNYNFNYKSINYNILGNNFIITTSAGLNKEDYNDQNPTDLDKKDQFYIYDNNFKLLKRYNATQAYWFQKTSIKEKNVIYLISNNNLSFENIKYIRFYKVKYYE